MIAAPLTYELDAHVCGAGISMAQWPGSELRFDTSPTPGTSTLPGPADLLLAAFAACVLKNVERFAAMLRFEYQEAAIHVSGERSSAPPRMTTLRYTLRIVTDEPPRRVDLLHRNIREHGTIYNTLAAVCAVSGELVVTPATSGVPGSV